MNPTANPVVSPVIALATWLSLLPLSALLEGRAHLVEAALLVTVVGIIGALGALLGLGRGGTYASQVVGGVAMLVWRGLMLGPGDTGFLDTFRALVQEGSATIAASAPPLDATNGVVFLILALTALVQLVLELLVNVLEQPAWSFAPLALGYVVAGIAASEELTVPTFAVVAGSYVLLLLVATGIGEGHRAARASRSGAFHLTRAGLALLLTVGGVAGAAAVQPLLPMGSKQPWQDTQSGPIQLGDPTVALNENLRRPEDVPMFSYTTSTGAPSYFRTVAMPDLTTDGVRLIPMTLRNFGLSGAYSAPGVPLEVEVQMRAVPSEYLPVPFAVDDFSADGVWSYDPETLAVVATGADRQQQTVNLRYTASSTVPSPSPEELDAAEAGQGVDPITTVVPDVDPRVAELTRQVVEGAGTAGQKAQRIQSFLRGDDFEYSLDAPQTATLDVVSSFLLEDRYGYCIHFAAGMMTMARIEGIPSRMAIGFNSGTQQEDGSFLVTSHNMHAWPELYFEGLGWVAFEPTPAVASPPSYTDADPTGPSAPEPSPSPSPSPTNQSESPEDDPQVPVPPTTRPVSGAGDDAAWVLPTVLGLLGLALVAAAPLGIRTAQARWRLRPGQGPAELAAGAWREVRATFVDTGRDWPDGSPGPASRAVAGSVPEPELLRGIALAVERATFSREPVDPTALPDQVQRLRRALYADAPWWARWWPRSLWGR